MSAGRDRRAGRLAIFVRRGRTTNNSRRKSMKRSTLLALAIVAGLSPTLARSQVA
jgi:hypothetical protein